MNMHVSGYNQYGINHKNSWTHYWRNTQNNVSFNYTLQIFRDWSKDQSVWISGFLIFLPLILLISAIVFSLFNWIYQSMEINKFMNTTSKFSRRLANLILFFSQLLILITLIALFMQSWFLEYSVRHIYDIYSPFIAAGYLITSIAYWLTGCYYYSKLKAFSMKKAKQMKNRIFWSIALISGPLIIRSVYNGIKFEYNLEEIVVRQSRNENNIYSTVFIVCYYILVDYLPIWTQMVGMILVIDYHYQNNAKVRPIRLSTNNTSSNDRSEEETEDAWTISISK